MADPTAIVVLSPGIPPPIGGSQRLTADIHTGLGARAEVRTIAVSASRVQPPGVIAVPSGRGAGVRLALASLQGVSRSRCDVVHAMSWKVAAPVTPVTRQRLLAVHALGAELIRPRGLQARLRDATLDRADVVVAISNHTANLVADMTRRPVRVVTPGVTLPDQRSARPRRDGELHVLSVAAHVRRKGHPELIEAVALARAAGRRIRLTIAGDGPDRGLAEAAIQRQAAGGFVTLAGRVTDDELRALYLDADAFALHGIEIGDEFEGFGIVLVEAAAYGLPIVTTATGGTGDAMQAGENALVVTDPATMAHALIELFDDPALADRLATAGIAFAAGATVERRADELLEVYRTCRG